MLHISKSGVLRNHALCFLLFFLLFIIDSNDGFFLLQGLGAGVAVVLDMKPKLVE